MLTRTARIYLALSLTQAAHSIEEMLSHLYEFFDVLRTRVPGFPWGAMNPDTFAAINMTLIAVLLASVPFVQARRGWALGLAGLAASVEILNGAGHIGIALLFGRYIPGVITAPVLLVLGILLLRELWRSAP